MLKLNGVKLPVDKMGFVCYYVCMINKIKNKYYNYQPGEFLPIYMDGKLANRKQFHMYKIKWIVTHRSAFAYQLTHSRG